MFGESRPVRRGVTPSMGASPSGQWLGILELWPFVPAPRRDLLIRGDGKLYIHGHLLPRLCVDKLHRKVWAKQVLLTLPFRSLYARDCGRVRAIALVRARVACGP